MKTMRLFLIFLFLGASALMQGQQKPTILLVGDSTVKNGRGDGSGGLWGWGDALPLWVDTSKVSVQNHALGGMSSRTYYYSPTNWKKVLEVMKPGDFVLIQLGHNDGGGLSGMFSTRATLRGVGEETQEIENSVTRQKEVVHTYGWYLRQYIKETRAKGATPILCTPIPRNDWVDGKMPKPVDGYPIWAAQVAREEKVALIDLYELSRLRLESIGQTTVTGTYYPASDHTHTLADGAMLNASLVVEGLRAIEGCPLIPFLLDKPSGSFPIKRRLFIMGDSTVANSSGEKIVGWGRPIAQFFDTTRIEVINRARGGRSSRTFYNEGLWSQIYEQLRPGDFVLMGFGHNDGSAPTLPMSRGSLPGTGPDTVELSLPDGTKEIAHTYGWYMRTYVTQTKSKGATPILFSQVPWRELYDGKSKRVTDSYAKWLAEIAQEQEIVFIDLNDLVAKKYEAMGQEAVNAFFPGDHTHTNNLGATLNAFTMVEAIRSHRGCALGGYILRPLPQVPDMPSQTPVGNQPPSLPAMPSTPVSK